MNGFQLNGDTLEVTRIPHETHNVFVYNIPFGTHTDVFRTLFNARDFSLSEGTASMIFDSSQIADEVINQMNGQQYGGNILEVTRTSPHIRNYPP